MTPKCLWYSGLFNPMAYNTAVMQVTARQQGQPLDNMTTETHVTTFMDSENITCTPEDGVLISGLFIEGARWMSGEDAGDITKVSGVPTQGYLELPILKELLPSMPVIYLKAVVVQPQWEPSSVGYLRHDPHIYECPIYVTSFRGPTYVCLGTLKSLVPTSNWVLGGVAILLQSDD